MLAIFAPHIWIVVVAGILRRFHHYWRLHAERTFRCLHGRSICTVERQRNRNISTKKLDGATIDVGKRFFGDSGCSKALLLLLLKEATKHYSQRTGFQYISLRNQQLHRYQRGGDASPDSGLASQYRNILRTD